MPRKALPIMGKPRIELYEGDIDPDMARIGTIKNADKITGGLSKPSKMPGHAYNIPASECKRGRATRMAYPSDTRSSCSTCGRRRSSSIYCCQRSGTAFLATLWCHRNG
jgi:hypothetical protein